MAIKVTFTVEVIGPVEAATYLGSNTRNRKLKDSVIDKYAGAMARGEWTMNGEAIKFDDEGVLLDGQHRLAAVVKSGVAITTAVARGLQPETQDSLDHHTPRTLADVLALHGEKNCSDLSSALTYLWRTLKGIESSTSAPSAPQALAFLDEHPSLRESLRYGDKIARLGVPRGITAAMHYVFASLDGEDAEYFFARLADGENLPSTSAIYAYREWCIRELRSVGIIGRRPNRTRVQALMVKAWNAYRQGVEVRQLKWSVGGARPEPFPKAA